MSEVKDLTDEQWVVLDILYRAKKKGAASVHRREILYSESIPQSLGVRLTFHLLLIVGKYVDHNTANDTFSITAAGIEMYQLRFGHGPQKIEPSPIADHIIYLPDRSKEVFQ